MSDEQFDFEEFGKQFNEIAIATEEIAKFVVPQYLAYRKMGLSVQEAAALTAAIISHTMPTSPQEPKET